MFHALNVEATMAMGLNIGAPKVNDYPGGS